MTALLVRNEADKFLARVLTRCAEFSDRLLVLDDHSTDDSVDVAHSAGAEVRIRSGDPMWGAETPARVEIWNWAAEVAGDGWVLICDADQLLVGDPRPYCRSWDANAWAFPLYDCWDDEGLHRADGFWVGYRVPRPWLFRPSAVPDGWVQEWSGRGLHCGHAPHNFPMVAGVAPDLSWLHLAYLTKAQRITKYAQYMSKADQLTPFEEAHAQSILDD